MKNTFTEEDVGKSFKLTIKDRDTNETAEVVRVFLGEYKIPCDNTNVQKLWNLTHNGLFTMKTIEDIFKNNDPEFIIFNSKQSYEKFKRFEFSNAAMHQY